MMCDLTDFQADLDSLDDELGDMADDELNK